MATMTLTRSRTVDALADRVWDVIADLDGYADHADSLVRTTVVSGKGEGARRRCVDASGADWEEDVAVWEPGRRYVVEVDVATYPAKFRTLFRTFTGTWEVEPLDDRRSRVTIRFEAELRRVPGLAAVVGAMGRRAEADLDATLDSYANAAQATTGS